MNYDIAIDRIRDFVSRFDHIPDVQFSSVPYPLASHEGIAYLLMVASINQNTSAEHVRDLMQALTASWATASSRLTRCPRRVISRRSRVTRGMAGRCGRYCRGFLVTLFG